jgi:D-xylose 1-dehydrogenase (NADP+, D-xylono-1,5-lactone-forming)
MSGAAPKLRIGVLGAANIARSFIAALRGSTKVDVCAVASRDSAKAAAFAKETGVAQSFGSYEAMLADQSIEAIYNPLPNNLHAEWTIKAANAGKHVLCEKPLAANAMDAVAMFAAARTNEVYVVEAYPYRAQPQTIKLAELVRNNAIGRVQTVQASFGFPLVAPNNIRWDPTLAGGALMDAGSYPVSLVRLIAGERPVRAQAFAQFSESGVDRTLMGALEFASGLIAQISCSFGTARHRRAFIIGDVGTIDTTYFNDTGAEFPPLVHITRGSGWDAVRETIECAAMPGFFAQGEAFHDLVRHGWGAWPGATPAESTDIALALDALAASAKTGSAVHIPQAAM